AIAWATASGAIAIAAILARNSGSVVNSVSVAPGQTRVSWISGPTSWRSTSQSARTPALLAAYTPCPGTHLAAAVEVTVTKWPDPCALNTGSTAAIPCSTPRRFTSSIRFQSLSVPSASGATVATPALATSASRRSNCSTESAMSRLRSSGRVTSTTHAVACPPSASISATIRASASSRRAPSTTRAPRAASSRAVAAASGRTSPRRADAARNRERILDAARTALTAAEDIDAVTMHSVAQEAGVCQGTLYRHFPTREDLVLAVYHTDVERLIAAAAELSAEHPPREAMHRWLAELAAYGRVK